MSFKIYFEDSARVVNHKIIENGQIKRFEKVQTTKTFLLAVDTDLKLRDLVFSLDPNTQAEYYIESESGVTLRMDRWVNNLIQNRST